MARLRPDIGAAEQQMRKRLGSGREVRRLVRYLWEGEQVAQIAAGAYGQGIGVIVLTDRRVIFLKDGWTHKTTMDFPLEKVASVQWGTGVVLGTLAVFATGSRAEIHGMNTADGKRMAAAIRSVLSTPRQAAAEPARPDEPAADTAAPEPDVYVQLGRLGELRDAGVLTVEEFEAKKAELLARI
jgi:hypothetical protein